MPTQLNIIWLSIQLRTHSQGQQSKADQRRFNVNTPRGSSRGQAATEAYERKLFSLVNLYIYIYIYGRICNNIAANYKTCLRYLATWILKMANVLYMDGYRQTMCARFSDNAMPNFLS